VENLECYIKQFVVEGTRSISGFEKQTLFDRTLAVLAVTVNKQFSWFSE